MLAKKYLALLFCLCLVFLLFYSGINLAEQGTKDLLGVDAPSQGFRVYFREGGELEIFWSGSSRVINVAFITERAAQLKGSLHSFVRGLLGTDSR